MAKPTNLLEQVSPLRAIALLIGCLILHNAPAANLPGIALGPLVQVINTEEKEDHADIAVQFACSVRYIGNMPINHGTNTTITLRLGPDCGSLLNGVPPELPLVGGNTQLVTGARLESMIPGEVRLELTWARDLNFVMAPSASGLGLRIRLLGTGHKKASVFLSEVEAPQGYAVNLDSSQTKIEREQVQAAAASLQTQAFVSETDIEDQHWYRLRVGPFSTKKEAERVLEVALATYPRAWLAVNDEQTDLTVAEHAGVQSAADSGPTDPAVSDVERAKILGDARVALAKHQYPEATDLLTRLLRQPEYPARADAQELAGLVRERAGQLAQAKAEYQAYLLRYPNGSTADRVRGRLQTLATASLTPKNVGEFGAKVNAGWSAAGSLALTYQYGKTQTNATGVTTSATSVNAALLYGDILVRNRGERYDFTGRFNSGYTKNILTAGGGSQDRVTAAYGEVTDRTTGLTGRLGRQSLASQGGIGLFDGLYVGYQVNSKFTIGAAAGLPALSSYSKISSKQKFGTIAAEYGPFRKAWVFDAYLYDQTTAGGTDRRALGLQTRYSLPGFTAVVLTDYDIQLQSLNSITLIGNIKVSKNWIMGMDIDHRRSPQLSLSNALIGQNATDIPTLENPPPTTPPTPSYTLAQIKQFALDRSATSDTFVISASRAIGERWQFMADVSALRLTGTPASGGVAKTLSTGLDKNAAITVSGASLLQASDLHIFSLREDNSPSSRSTTVSWDARFALHGAWRLGPRLSVEQLKNPTLGSNQTLFLPQVRSDWTSRSSVLELTGGYQIERQQTLQQPTLIIGPAQTTSLDQRALYISAAYRLRF